MKILLCLLLTCLGVSAATPSFSSFNTNQFSTNNLFISIKDGASVTNITNTRSGGSSPSSVATLGDLLWRDVAGEATLTNTMESMVFFHDLNAGDDDSIALDYFVTTDQNFTNYAGLYAPFSSTSSSIQSFTIFGNGGPTEENRVQLSTDATSASIQMLFNGVLTDGFNVATPSGYTGGGTLFLSDDGTYKAVGGVGGDSIWTNITGYVTMIPGQTATNTLAFTSGAVDNATNVIARLNTSSTWVADYADTFQIANNDTNNFRVTRLGTLQMGPKTRDWWGGYYGEFITAMHNIDEGDPDSAAASFDVINNAGLDVYMDLNISSANSEFKVAWTTNGSSNRILSRTSPTDLTFKMEGNSVDLLAFDPNVSSSGTAVAYKFDTSNNLNTSGDLISTFGNNGTARLRIYPFGGMGVGSQVPSFYGSLTEGDALIGVSDDSVAGESGRMFMQMTGMDTGTGLDGTFQIKADEDELFLILQHTDNGNTFRMENHVEQNNIFITLESPTATITSLNPTIASSGSAIAYLFNTSNTLTNGDKFVSIQNAGTEVLNISPNSTGAQIVFGPGATNVLSRSGTDLVYTNGATTPVYFKVQHDGGTIRVGASGSTAQILADTSAAIGLAPDNGSTSFLVASTGIYPTAASKTLGTTTANNQWFKLFLSGTLPSVVWNGTTNTVFDTAGAGDPNGTVTADIGSTYRRYDGVLSIKTDGTGNTGWQPVHVGNQAYLAANGTVSDATLVNLSLSVGVTSGKKYAFRCVLYCANSTAGDGVKIDFDGGSAAATNFRAHAKITDAALLTSTQTSALATDITAATITGDTEIEVNGSFEPSGTGTLIPRFAENSDGGGTLTVYRGSHLILTEIP